MQNIAFIIGISFNACLYIMLISEKRLEICFIWFVEKKQLIHNFEKNNQNR
jgi:hypothetical protein